LIIKGFLAGIVEYSVWLCTAKQLICMDTV
jgi:hypothetical protein